MPEIEKPEIETYTISQAIQRHRGLDRNFFLRRCENGKKLIEQYGSRENVPPKQRAMVIFAKKHGKCWHIPKSELDRLFL